MSNEEETTVTKAPRRFSWKCASYFVLLLIVILIAIMLAIPYFQPAEPSLKPEIEQLQSDIASLRKQLSSLQTENVTLRSTLQTVGQKVQTIAETDATKKTPWAVAEARYLIKLADAILQLEQNPALAAKALQLADEQLKEVSDANVDAVRKALAADILALQSVPAVDVKGIYMKLFALQDYITQLSLRNQPSGKTLATTVEPMETLPWWKRGLQNTWGEIRQLVSVRYNASNQMPFMTPDQQALLYQNCRAELMQAMWALTHGQPEIYQKSLQQVTTWIKTYFVVDSSETNAVLTELANLEKVDIHPTLPSISSSTEAIQSLGS